MPVGVHDADAADLPSPVVVNPVLVSASETWPTPTSLPVDGAANGQSQNQNSVDAAAGVTDADGTDASESPSPVVNPSDAPPSPLVGRAGDGPSQDQNLLDAATGVADGDRTDATVMAQSHVLGPPPPSHPADASLHPVEPLEIVGPTDDTRSHQLNLGFAALISRARTQFRKGVRRGYEVLARRLGMILILCSGVHILTCVFVAFAGQEETFAYMTNVLAVSAVLLHVSLALAHDSMRGQVFSHFGLLVLNAILNAAFQLARRDFTSAAISIFWVLVLYPLAGVCLNRLLRAAYQMDRETKDALSHSTTTAFAISAMPILYFFCNGMLCIGFENKNRCAIRTKVRQSRFCAVRERVPRTRAAYLALVKCCILFRWTMSRYLPFSGMRCCTSCSLSSRSRLNK
jgi:hypothetical protein